MTKKRSTKSALLSSALALFLCFAMLLGTTFAWFTDSVTSANNIIMSGNLDVELEYWNGQSWVDVNGKRDILTNELFEPGVTEVAYFRIANAGTLALKYQLGINIVSEKAGVNVFGREFKLSDFIMFGIDNDITVNAQTKAPSVFANREAAVEAIDTVPAIISTGYTSAETMLAGEEIYFALVVYMPTTVGNEANYKTDAENPNKNRPQIDLGINIFATQVAFEEDSFNNTYDDDAPITTAPILRPENTAEDMKIKGVNDVVVTLPADLVNALPAEITEIGISVSDPVVENNGVFFGTVELLDQNGDVIDLEDLDLGRNITVALPVPANAPFANGETVMVYHDGAYVSTATVVDGEIVYEVAHLCEITVGAIEAPTVNAENNTVEIANVSQLVAFANSVNGGNKYTGKTVVLTSDIDLNNVAWTPIGQTGKTTFAGSFDGNGKTIYNLNIDNRANTYEYGAAGLFGWVEQHSGSNSITNLTIDGVKIDSHRYSGAIAGWINIPVTNCTVKNVTINCSFYNDDTDGTKVGALVGYADNGSALTGNTVENANLTAYGDVGGLAGVAQTKVSVDGNTVKDVNIVYSSDKKSVPGEIVSTRITYVNGANTASNVTFTKTVLVSTAEELAAVLTGNVQNIVVTLANDIDMPRNLLIGGNAGDEYKMGGAITEAIKIDLNGYKLNVTTTYWSVLGTVNPDTVVTIINGTMTSSQKTGTWNSYDLCFASGNFVFEDVVFEKAIALETNATLKNVTINETHDYYALWITAEGQNVTIDGLTINSAAGRGIKIDEQYIDAPEKVTLSISNATFNTAKKAAIIVKSAAGADITLANVDIANTIDPIHTVWVDEDAAAYAELVTVTGGEKANEWEVALDASDLQKKLNNAKDGAYIELVNTITGDVTVTQKAGVKITVEGNGMTFAGVITVDGKSATYTTAGLTIKNVNFIAESISADACIRLGNGENATRYTCNVTVDNCTFDVPGAVGVKSYTGGDKNLTITGCTATSAAHSLVQIAGVDGVLIEDCEVYSKNGINTNQSDNVVISGCVVDVKGYAVRFGAGSGDTGAAETYLIKDCTLKSANDDGDATIILRGTADYSVLTIENTEIIGNPDITNKATGATIIK